MRPHRALPHTRFALLVVVCVLAAPVGAALAGSAHPQASTELLTNPGFEAPYIQQGVSFVASGWIAWWLTPDGATYPTSCPEGSPPTCMPYQLPTFRNTQPQDQREPSRALSGDSQSWGATYAVFVGGVYQPVGGVSPGTRLRFTASMYAFNCSRNAECFNPGGNFGRSNEPGNNQLRIGIDPAGGVDPFSSNVVWSIAQNPIDAFASFQVEAVAQASNVTVFLWAAPSYPAQSSAVYADSASLIALGQEQPPTVTVPTAAAPPATLQPGTTLTYTVQTGDTLSDIALRFGVPLDQLLALNNLTTGSIIQVGQVLIVGGAAVTPAPTQPPPPTATPPAAVSGTSVTYIVQSGDSLFSVATRFNLTLDQLLALNPGLTRDSLLLVGQTIVVGVATPAPTEAPAPTPTPTAGGLCLIAFDDGNGDGRRDSGEPSLAGVQFEVADGSGNSIARYTSTASEEPYCLNDLAAGRYTVSAAPPPDRLATSETSVLVGLLAGETFHVDFGSRATPTPTPLPPIETPAPTVAAQAETPRSDSAPLALLGIVLIVAAGLALGFALRARRR